MAKDFTPKFGDPAMISALAEESQKFENLRGQDRALIDGQFNGDPPFTAEEALKLRVEVNVNFGEGGKILDDANRQINSALLFKPKLATLSLLKGKPEKRVGLSQKATQYFNDSLKRGRSGRRWLFMLKSRNASLTLHGIGSILWGTSFSPKARFVALADLLIPTDTNCDHEDLAYFWVNLYLTQGELFEMVGGTDIEDGWNKAAVYQVLHWLQSMDQRNKFQDPCNPVENAERWAQYRKQNGGFFASNSDQCPKVKLRAFYYKDPTTNEWYRKVMLRYDAYETGHLTTLMDGMVGAKVIQKPGVDLDSDKVFLYESKEPFAQHLSEIIHIQYGDSSRVPPLKHHSVRGLGVSLYGPVECMNRMRCQFMQHIFINLLTWLRIKDPADRDRIKHFVMEQFAAFPEELDIIPAAERYQIPYQLVEAAQSQFRQLMNESSASYVRDIESGNKKEMTLGEAQIRLQQVNVQISGMLKSIYSQEIFLYEETHRRYLMAGTSDKVALKYQKKLKECLMAAGVPEKEVKDYMEPDCWQVDIEQVLGSGDATLAQNKANLLLSQKGMFDPEQARKVEREWVATITDDAAKAEMLVPDSPDKTTSGTIAAQNLFGTLMQGTQVKPREGIDQKGYIEQMLAFMGEKVTMITSTDNMGTPADVVGLTNVGADVQAHMAILARDPATKPDVKKFTDALAELMNLVKAFAQRQQAAMPVPEEKEPLVTYDKAPPGVKRQMEAAEGWTPDTSAESQTDPKTLKAVHSIQIKDQQFAQKQRHDQVAFQLEQVRENLRAVSEIKLEDAKARQQLAFDGVQKALDALHMAENGVNGNGNGEESS